MSNVRRYRSLSATVRGNADRAMCAASLTSSDLKVAERPVAVCGVEPTNGHLWLLSARLEPPLT